MYFCSICLKTYENIETAMMCCAVELPKSVEASLKETSKLTSKKLRKNYFTVVRGR